MSMTISITCDGCELTEECSTDMDSGANEIEDQLDPGWTHEPGDDRCPKCAGDGGDQ